jgi:hypothetical protein
LKLNCDQPLSNGAFNFNVRRYNTVYIRRDVPKTEAGLSALFVSAVGRCKLKRVQSRVHKRLV